MFCTGGIRCEKATSFTKFRKSNVYHLKGGILKYLRKTKKCKKALERGMFCF